MKDENDFNSHLGNWFKNMRPEIFHVKNSDRFQIGVSDFTLWRGGQSVVVECKFVKLIPANPYSLILKRVFTGPQQTFFKLIMQTRTRAFGLIAEDDRRRMIVFHAGIIPQNGNFTSEYLEGKPYAIFNFGDAKGLVNYMFSNKVL